MKQPRSIGLEKAREVLAGIGAEPDANGNRKLPFFVDPIEGKLKIERGTLVDIYRKLQIDAENGAKH